MSEDAFSSNEFDKLLNDFINSQLKECEDNLIDLSLTENTAPKTEEPPSEPAENTEVQHSEKFDDIEDISDLFEEEKRLYSALSSFLTSVRFCGEEAEIPVPEFNFSADDLRPRFKPKKIPLISNDILEAWDILLKAQPIRLSSLPNNPSDEQILNFAEKTSHSNLQLALISYVESLLEIEACEISYNIRYAKYQKHKLEKKIYEEKEKRRQKTIKYIEEIRKKNFPVDEERLVTNFFKTAKKDPEGAKKILENNPATYSPIQTEKIPNKFFGMIKSKPSDGFKINKKLGDFLKNLKI